MKVLISAYACEPHRGSEPEIGWQWAIHLSRHCDVTVITRSNNRESIEAEVKHLSGTRLRFVYHDLASRILSMKSALGSVGVYLYYFLWQAKTRKLISEMVDEEEFDEEKEALYEEIAEGLEAAVELGKLSEEEAEELWREFTGEDEDEDDLEVDEAE